MAIVLVQGSGQLQGVTGTGFGRRVARAGRALFTTLAVTAVGAAALAVAIPAVVPACLIVSAALVARWALA